MKLGIRAKLFVLSLSLIALSLAISYGYLRKTLDANLTTRIEQDLAQKLRLIAYAAEQANLSPGDPKHWQETAREAHVASNGLNYSFVTLTHHH